MRLPTLSSLGLSLVALGFVVVVPAAGQARVPRPTITKPTIMPATAGRYRVVITGFATAKETVDTDTDGKRDEVYAAAAVVLWDRRSSAAISQPTVVRTREYGDVGSGRYPSRMRAGAASPSGGLWAGNGSDYAPAEFDPRGTALPPPSMYQLPLMIFEGGLSEGVEALLVVPSLWESDNAQRHT